MLSDSGTTAILNQQWSAMFLGDESYWSNKGYYVLLDTFRDILVLDLVRTDCTDIEKMMKEMYLYEWCGPIRKTKYFHYSTRKNCWSCSYGNRQKSIKSKIPKKKIHHSINGHFYTTEGIIKQTGSIPRNLFKKELLFQVPKGVKYSKILSKVIWTMQN